MDVLLTLLTFLLGCGATKGHEVLIRRRWTRKFRTLTKELSEGHADIRERMNEVESRLASDALPTERLDTLERRFETLNQDVLRHTNKITKALARQAPPDYIPDEAVAAEPGQPEPETDAQMRRRIQARFRKTRG